MAELPDARSLEPQSTSLADRPVILQKQMSIDYDTLLLIIDFVKSPTDLLNLLTTCKAVYHLGLAQFLGRPLRFVDSKDSLRLKCFKSFMTEHPQYFQYIKELSLGVAKEDMSTLWELTVDILHKGTNIKRLNLSMVSPVKSSSDFIFHPHGPLLDSPIYGCQNLQHLSLHHLGVHYVTTILHSVEAPLKSVSITSIPASTRIGIKLAEPVIYPLQKFALTLEEIELENEVWPKSRVPLPTTFLRLHTLILRNTSLNGLENIINAFPNLKHFVYPGPCQSPASRRRSANLPIMKQLRRSGKMWKSPLITLEISSHALYGFGLKCQVNSLVLGTQAGYQSLHEVTAMDNLHRIINDIQPPQLTLSLSASLSKSIILHETASAEFYNLFSYPALTNLHMCPVLPFTESLATDVESFIVEFAKALENNKYNKICWLLLAFSWKVENNDTYDVTQIDHSGIAMRLATAAGVSRAGVISLYFMENSGQDSGKSWMKVWKVEAGDEWTSKP
ncbi:hypothetical protein C8Q75DRAFT_803569 [Abortiporus biennis]|nr:hypothetical protein C8Q75DRAFT_803569 [Abortiporus biennis]